MQFMIMHIYARNREHSEFTNIQAMFFKLLYHFFQDTHGTTGNYAINNVYIYNLSFVFNVI